MSTAVMMERIADASPRLKARIAGVFYLLTFLAGGFALFVGGRYGSAAGLIAGACYIAVTGLFYFLFKPVNRRLSLLAAFVSLAGCVIGPLSSLHFVPFQFLGIFRSLLPPDRLPHFQIDLPASNSGRADGVWRSGLADVSVTAARKLSVALQSGPRNVRGGSADPVAPRGRRERS